MGCRVRWWNSRLTSVWVSGSQGGEAQEWKGPPSPSSPFPPSGTISDFISSQPHLQWPPPVPVHLDKVAHLQWGWAGGPGSGRPGTLMGPAGVGSAVPGGQREAFSRGGCDCQSWKCQVAPEPHKGLRELFVEKGSTSLRALLDFSAATSALNGAVGFGLWTAYNSSKLRGPAHPSWEKLGL